MEDRLSILNAHPKRLEGPELLHDLAGKCADPEAIAIDFLGRDGKRIHLSYREVHAHADALGCRLLAIRQAHTASLTDRFIVPLYLPQGPDLYISQLAILKAGGAFCPIALDVPEERLRFLLQDVDTAVLLTTSALRGSLPALQGISILLVDEKEIGLAGRERSVDVEPSDAAYVLYTSGSTGQPKGVVISHSAVTQALLAHDRHIPPFARFLQFASPTFDVSVFEIFFTWFRGSTLVSCDRGLMLSDLLGIINALNIDAAELTPSVASTLLRDRKSVPSLQLLLTIGEMLKQSVIEEFAGDDREPGILYGMYGPTEATIHCTLQPTFNKAMSIRNLGVPLDTVSAFVLGLPTETNAADTPLVLPICEEGELAVGGHQLAEGYLNRDGQTRAAFINHPEYGRLYRTGDLAKMTRDGTIECLGRIAGGQVKLRGQRIELGEIEYAASRTEGCRSAIADIIDNALVAFCVCTGSSITASQILRSCRKWLSPFMVPGDVLVLQELPYLPSGKLDRKSLRDQYKRSRTCSPSALDIPSPREKRVAEILSNVLGYDINESTRLRDVGIDSLNAIKLASHFKRAEFPQVDANLILGAKDVRDLTTRLNQWGYDMAEFSFHKHADELAELRKYVLRCPVTSFQSEEVEDIFFCTPVQSSMLLETTRNTKAYCNWIRFELACDYSVRETQRAFQQLSERHQMLRSGFVQLLGSHASHAVVIWKTIKPSQIRQVETFCFNFTLETEDQMLRPVHIQICQVSKKVEVVLQIHHSLYDQWSIDVLKRDLLAVLRGRQLTTQSQFKAVAVLYAAEHHKSWSIDSMNFWRDLLQGFTPTVSSLEDGPESVTGLVRTPWRTMDFDLKSLNAETQATRANAPVLCQAAVICALGFHTQTSDVTIGTVFSGRHIAVDGIDGVFGPCLATLPVRIDLAHSRTCLDLAHAVHYLNRGVLRHSLIPLTEIKSVANCPPGVALFDTLFIWQETSLDFQGCTDSVQETDSIDEHGFSLVFEFEPKDLGITFRATYRADLLSAQQVNELLRHIDHIAQSLASHPDSPLEELTLNAGERLWLKPSDKSGSKPRRPELLADLSSATGEISEEKSLHQVEIALALAETLGVPKETINPNASFFSFGLNSLNAIAFSKLLQVRLRKSFTVNTVLRNPSVVQLSTFADEMACPQDEKLILKIESLFSSVWLRQVVTTATSRGFSIEHVLPCTPLQEAMLSASESNNGLYCNTITYRIAGDLGKLRACWTSLIARHQILRTTFVNTESPRHPFAQVVLKENVLPWVESEIGENCMACTNGRPLNDQSEAVTLSAPWHIKVSRTRNDIYMTLQMHHAIYDGLSMSIILDEVEKLYQGANLPPSISLEPFLAEVVQQDGSEAFAFWSSWFHDYQPKPFPQRSQVPEPNERKVVKILPMSRWALGEFCKRRSVTPLSVFQAAWVKTLSVCQQTRDVCFGNVVSGRSVSISGIEQLVGPCFNTIPLRVDLNEISTNDQLIQCLHRCNIDATLFQLTSLRRIQAMSQAPHLHLFDSLILLQPPKPSLNPSIWTEIDEHGTLDGTLVLELIPENDVFTLVLHTSQVKFTQAIAENLARAFISSILACMRYTSSDVRHIGTFDETQIAGVLISHLGTDSAGTSSPNQPPGGNVDSEDWTPQEKIVREVFANLSEVSVQSIHQHTSIYQLGLDSLNAAQIASQLRRRGMSTDVTDVIKNLTPSAIGAVSRYRHGTISKVFPEVDMDAFEGKYRNAALHSSGLHNEMVEAVRPCTPIQAGMLAQSVHSRGSFYINHLSYQVPDSVSITGIQHAWKAIQRKHQILRTGFFQTEDSSHPFAMVVYTKSAAKVPVSVSHSHFLYREYETQAASDIVNGLLQPAWRLLLNEQAGKFSMTLSIHHALYDAASLQVILSDFAKAIQSRPLSAGCTIDRELTATLAAVDNHTSESKDFWRHLLRTASTARFPDLSTVTVNTSEMLSRWHTCGVPSSTIESYSRNKGVTVQAIGQTAWALLLAAYVGDPNVTFGTVLSARFTDGEVVFPCITTVPVTCDTTLPITELVNCMVDINALLHCYRLTPLTEIHRMAERGTQSLFDTIFVYQKRSLSDSDFPWPIIREYASVDYAVSLELELPRGANATIRLTSDPARVPEPHTEVILRQYEHILMTLIGFDAADSNLTELYSIVPAQHQMLPTNVRLLHEFVEEGAKRIPRRPALEYISTRMDKTTVKKVWSYEELNDRANQVAHLIRRHGIAIGSIVAVCMSKCAEASFCFIGILKAGCSFLALDPDLPRARRTFIMDDSQTGLLFVDTPTKESNCNASAPVVNIQDCALDQFPTSPVDIGVLSPVSTCYVLYTSGTTGTPKGCEITHENAVQAMLAFQRLFDGHWDLQSRWLQFASYWFDVSILEQFWSWSVGITVVGAARDLVLTDLSGFIREARITHIDLTPSLARLLHPDDVPTLHHGVFITGGEALKQEIIDTWGSKGVICNGYGPTEATIGVTMNRFLGINAKASNIGRQFENVGSYVLAPDSEQPVLQGAIGELCVSGPLVGKGYLDRPVLTAKHFPTLSKFGERVYRTGDLVRLLADNSFAFVGRKDTQVKLRGQRLEITEIEDAIKASWSNIRETLALVIKTNDGNKETLVSFIILHQTTSYGKELHIDYSPRARHAVTVAQQACRNQLPGYMVPTLFIPVILMPLTVNNKIDTKKLIHLYNSLSTSDLQRLLGNIDSGNALSPTELQVRSILSRMLAINEEHVGKSSNVFSLGLSSVSAITLASLLKRAGFKSASVGVIMNNPSIEQLSIVLSGDKYTNQSEQYAFKQAQLSITAFSQLHRVGIRKRLSVSLDAIDSITPCTPLQEGLVLDSMRLPERPYFNEFRYSLRRVDIERLTKAFHQLVDHVEILRARFIQTSNGYAQVILAHAWVPFTKHGTAADLDPCLTEPRKRWLDDNEHDLIRPLELHVVSLPGHDVLIFYVHHALYDGISWALLIEHLAETYRDGVVPDCSPRFTAVLPFGPLLRQQDEKAFWKQRLTGFQYSPLSTQPKKDESIAIASSLVLPTPNIVENLRKDLGVSHQAVLQACFEVTMLQHFSHLQTYGSIVSGRSVNIEGADRVLGPMFNTLPHLISVGSADTWSDHVRRCHQSSVTILPYQQTSLRDIRRWLAVAPSAPMFDVLFVFQHQHNLGASPANSLLEPRESRIHAEYPLALELTLEDDGTLRIHFVARSDVASKSLLQAILKTFQETISIAAHNSTQYISTTFAAISTKPTFSRLEHQNHGQSHVNGVTGFDWTSQAMILRQTIANLADIGPERVDEHSSIFSLGLDSIDTVKLSSRLSKAGIRISLSRILRAQTIPRILEDAETADMVVDSPAPAAQLDGLELRLRYFMSDLAGNPSVERVLPATPNQEALLAEMLRSEFQNYYNHNVLRLRPSTNISQLKLAFQQVVDKTAILRTRFVEVVDPNIDLAFAQVVERPAPLELNTITLTDAKDLENLLEDLTAAVKATFWLHTPLRLTFVHIDGQSLVIVSMAHAQYDGHSLALFHEDVKRAYYGTLGERPTYDGVIEASLSATSQDALDFWTEALSGASAFAFPSSRVESSTSLLHRAERRSDLTAQSARSFCQRYSVSMQSLAQTCWALLLAHYTRNLEVMFGVVLACRDSEEAEQVMFPTMNTVIMRAALHGSRGDMLRYIQGFANDVLPYQRSPLRLIQAACAGQRRSPQTQLFNTLFIYQHRPAGTAGNREPLYNSAVGKSSVEYPVAVELETVGDEIIIRAACKDSIFDQKGTAQLLQTFDDVLQGILNGPDESTVAFAEDGISVCRLPSFQVVADAPRSGESESGSDDGNITEPCELSALALTIRGAVAQVTKIPADDISPTMTIENMGIDSISAIKVSALLRRQEISLSVGQILRAKTTVRMAEIASETVDSTNADAHISACDVIANAISKRSLTSSLTESGLEPGNIEVVIPGTAGQLYMFSVWQRTEGQLYHPTFMYKLNAGSSIEHIQQAWSELVICNPMLRVVFCATKDQEIPLLQVVLKAVDSFYYEGVGPERNVQAQPMATLHAIEQDEGYLLRLKIHHALYDAVSLRLLIQDFQMLLRESRPRQPQVKYEDFVALAFSDQIRKTRKDFWTAYLARAKPTCLNRVKMMGAKRRVEVFKPGSFFDVSALEELARKESVTLQALLFAAYAKAYAGLTNGINKTTREVVLGVYLANRSYLPELDSLRAPTLNLVPLLVRSPAETSLLEMAKQIQENLGRIVTAENSAVSLAEIDEWCGIKVDTFINFIKLPEQTDHERLVFDNEGGVMLREADERRTKEYAHVVEPDQDDWWLPAELQDMRALDAYQLSVDVEVAVSNGALDLGIFCPEEMLSLTEAETVIENVILSLEKLAGKSRTWKWEWV